MNRKLIEFGKKRWQNFDGSKAPMSAGIYSIGHKKPHKATEYKYVGRAGNLRRRLKQHESGGRRQAISKFVQSKLRQGKRSELRMKSVPEKKHRLREGEYIKFLEEQAGYQFPFNKRKGDGLRIGKSVPRRRTRPSSALYPKGEIDLYVFIWGLLNGLI